MQSQLFTPIGGAGGHEKKNDKAVLHEDRMNNSYDYCNQDVTAHTKTNLLDRSRLKQMHLWLLSIRTLWLFGLYKPIHFYKCSIRTLRTNGCRTGWNGTDGRKKINGWTQRPPEDRTLAIGQEIHHLFTVVDGQRGANCRYITPHFVRHQTATMEFCLFV